MYLSDVKLYHVGADSQIHIRVENTANIEKKSGQRC